MKSMKRLLAGFLLSVSLVNSIYAQTVASEALPSAQPITAASEAMFGEASPNPAAQSSLPPGVITEQNPLKLAVIDSKKWARKAYYRPNENMPDLINEDLLRGMLPAGKSTEQARSEVVGYLPRLVVLPCSDGCSGSAYDNAVDALKKGFRGETPNIVERGEMIVRISHLHHRSILANFVPTFNDSISVQFVLQGRLVTLSRAGIAAAAHGSGGNTTDMAEGIGAQIGKSLLLDMGVGVAPVFTVPVLGDGLHKAMTGVLMVGNAVLRAVGTDTAESTVGPVPDGDVSLLPAIDGIGPNEVEPLTETTAFGW